MFVKNAENHVEITGCEKFNLGVTLDCGQAFRWKQNDDFSWTGVVKGVETTVTETPDGYRFDGVTLQQFNDVFFDYFDFGRNYGQIIETLSEDRHLTKAIEKYGIIRILRQDPWETLCSFIISSCNNIPRIKGIIETLCSEYGEKTKSSYTFPSVQTIAALNIDDLDILRAGYRSPYILGAAKMIAENEIDLDSLFSKSIEECQKELTKIKGVGKKVADCTILFGLGHIDAFPIDRHIKRFCDNLYPDGLPECTKGIEGIAQQYMFHLQRMG